ncbi:MAG TPA: DUF3108 domain-containing protein [Bacteroidales bacterium]|nr:DUF3108 domain-containing protein [Bacteroidales bacterium]
MNSYIKIIGLIVLLFVENSLKSQCIQGEIPFTAGEVLNYDVVYNWGVVWINAATVRFKITETTYENRKAFGFISEGKTLPEYNWFYKVDDRFESVADFETLQSYYYRRRVQEGSYTADEKLWFNPSEKKLSVDVERSTTPRKQYTLPWNNCGFDLITAVYFVRTLNFSNYKINDRIPIKVVIDGEWFDLYVRFAGKELLTMRDGRQFNCFKLKPLLVEGTIFKGGEDMTVWVADDKAKTPVLIEAKILVGSVKAILIK